MSLRGVVYTVQYVCVVGEQTSIFIFPDRTTIAGNVLTLDSASAGVLRFFPFSFPYLVSSFLLS